MSKRRNWNESMENFKRVIEAEKGPETTVAIDPVQADAYNQNKENEKHLDDVKKELDKAADSVTPEKKKEETPVTAKLVLDEDISDFELTSTDGRANKVYEDDEDEYLDFDMFDFIYGLVTDCHPKPLNPLGTHRLRKFMYIGSDKYITKEDELEDADHSDGHSQVAANGDTIEVYANTTDAFEDIKKICDLYKFRYEGPLAKKSRSSYWNFSFVIHVPCEHSGYPMMVEDYFDTLGMTLEDVMPSDFCKQYRKRQAKIDAEVTKRLNEIEVNKFVKKAIMTAAQDSDPLEVHLKKLYNDLDRAKLTYSKMKIKKDFMDAFADDEDLEEAD